MAWVPVQQKHAIERVRFELTFSEQLTARLVEAAKRTFDKVRTEVRFDEPKPQDYHQLVLQPGAPAPSVTTKTLGWQASRELAPGHVVEALILNQSVLVYESADYKGWAKALPRFNKVAKELVQQISEAVDFSRIGLDYVDRFVYQGDPLEANPGHVFEPDLLAPLNDGARSGRFLWHVHRGWLDEIQGRTILMNQNFDAQDGMTPEGDTARSIGVLTKAEFRPKPDQFKVDDLDAIAHQLHDLCNDRFAQALTDAGREMVGMAARGGENV